MKTIADSRVGSLAKILVEYSIGIQKGEKLAIQASSPLARPLVSEVARLAIDKGAHTSIYVDFPDISEYLLKKGSEDQWRYVPEKLKAMAEECDARIYIDAPENILQLRNCSTRAIQVQSKARLPWMEKIWAKRWVIANYPTQALAQQAEMSLSEYEDFLYSATNINWREVSREQKRIVEALEGSELVHIIGKETDIKFNVKGRKWINCDGRFNMPDGEVFTSPVETDINGKIYFDMPSFYQGRKVEGIRFAFKGGVVISATADTNQEFLQEMLNTDEYAKYCGELAFGFNRGIKSITGDILFDEKIGGTMHIALGNAYEEAGGEIESAIHWDIIRNLNQGMILVDDHKLYENGKWLI